LSAWTEWEFIDYTYNTDFSFDDLLLQANTSMIQPCYSMLISREQDGDARQHGITEYYYSQVMVENDAPLIESNDLAIFPNPASSTVSVRLPEGLLSADFYLFDIQGRCIIETSIQTESQISISELSNGLYFYKVIVGVDTFSGKLIKE
jgi:hypothetical protein